MKTIEMKVGNKSVSFTTKSVTIDGVEYLYGKMSGIKHSAEKHIYAFKYDGQYKYLPYDPKYAQVLGAIFKQVNNMDKKRQAAIAKTAEVPVEAPTESPVEATADTPMTLEERAETTPVADAPEASAAVSKAEDTPTPVETAEEPSTETKAEVPAESKAEVLAESTTETPVKTTAKASDAEKKAKLKKSIIVFVLILAIIGALTAGYFALFGTTSNPTAGPNSTESQQYDDIDELIKDLD